MPLLGTPSIAVVDSGVFMIPQIPTSASEVEAAQAEAMNALA